MSVFNTVQTSLTEGLVAFYNLEEAMSTPRLDSSGNNITLTDVDAVSQVSGVNSTTGNAAHFTSIASQYLVSSNFAILSNITTTVSTSFWYFNTTTNNSTFVCLGETTSNFGFFVGGQSGTNGIRVLFNNNIGSNFGRYAFSQPFMQWHHVAVNYNGSGSTNANKLQIYYDNVQQTVTFNGTIPSSISYGVSPPFVNLGGVAGFFMNGSMDCVGIWNRNLTPQEIGMLYNGGNARQCPNLI